MKQRTIRAAVGMSVALAAVGIVQAQRGGNDWMTIGNDVQRSYWIRNDGKISVDSLKKPGFGLYWKHKFNNVARQMNSITAPALLDFSIFHKGFRTLGFFGASNNTIVTLDTDMNRLEWERKFAPVPASATATAACPGGMTSTVTRPTAMGYPAQGARGAGRGTGAKSGVGAPFEGAVTIRPQAGNPPPPPTTAPAKRVAPAGNPFARQVQWLNAITADGKFHSVYLSNGDEPNPPVDFLPANAHARGLVVFDKTAYAATVNGCGGVPDGIWALDLESKKVTSWKSTTGMSGAHAFAADPDGTLYVAAGTDLVALAPKTLAVKSTFKGSKAFSSSPLIFDHNGKDLLAIVTADGQLQVHNTEVLEAPPVASFTVPNAAGFAAGALSSWQDLNGARWILVPTSNAVVAVKMTAAGSGVALQAGWTSRALQTPITPIVVNGVVFALASGQSRDEKLTMAQRVQRSTPAVLYALDGATGQELWNSGAHITSFVSSGGLVAGGGRVYVSGHDGTQYSFAFPMEI